MGWEKEVLILMMESAEPVDADKTVSGSALEGLGGGSWDTSDDFACVESGLVWCLCMEMVHGKNSARHFVQALR